jgi:hypothetical protein
MIRTVAAVAALAASSFAAQASVTSIALDGANLGKWVFFEIDASLAKDHSTSFIDQFGNTEQFTFGAPARGWQLDVVDLGAPGDMFNIFANGAPTARVTDPVQARSFATVVDLNAAAVTEINRGGNNFGIKCLGLTWSDGANQKVQDCAGDAEKQTSYTHYSGTNIDGGFKFRTAEVITGSLYQENSVAGQPYLKTIGAIRLSGRSAPIPEPTTAGLLFAGLAIVGTLARRRRAAI